MCERWIHIGELITDNSIHITVNSRGTQSVLLCLFTLHNFSPVFVCCFSPSHVPLSFYV